MASPLSDSSFNAMNEIAHCARQLKQLLADDKQYISKNDISGLDKSNQQKAQLLERMGRVLHPLSEPATSNEGLMTKIEKYIAKLDHQTQQKALQQLANFKVEISECYQQIMTNKLIVSANLNHLKNIWNKIADHKTRLEGTYDKSGKLVR